MSLPKTDQNTNEEHQTTVKQIGFKCQYCNNQFSRNTSLKRHVNEGRCKIKTQMDYAVTVQTLQTLNKKIQELEKSQNNINSRFHV